jgi:hypothetical protein
MKKIIIISLALIFCLSFLAIAEADLMIEDFTIRQDNPEARESYHYILDVKNVGDEAVDTCLPAEIYFEDAPYLKFPDCLLRSLTNPRGDGTDIASVTIISEDGSETEVTPEWKDLEYMTAPLTAEEVAEKKDMYVNGPRGEMLTEEELANMLTKLDQAGIEGEKSTMNALVIELTPGETLRYQSEESYNQLEQVTIPPGKLSLEPWELTVNIQLDRFNTADENQNNNLFSTEIMVEPTIIQGPKEASSRNRELDDENEYFSLASGCAMVQGKEICVSLDDPNISDDEENLVISVDGSEEVYSYYGLMMAWFYQWFGDGRLAPAEVNNGVEIIVYDNGFKFSFPE